MKKLMTKLLTICIPTYKRPDTLRRCIDSVVSQIEKYELSECVDIYVTNDASPDDTVGVLHAYESLGYFHGVTREQNLGMNVNIKCMLSEVAKKSDYQLIITDDDYLQLDILGEIVEFLRVQQDENPGVHAIWTPRFSYTEDGELHCVVCNPFQDSSLVEPSAANAGKYMNNGFVLSGLILRAKRIDYEFWEQYSENAYFPMIFFGDLLFRGGAYFWNKNIVHHTVLNKCHWESWGRSNLLIELKKFSDFVNTYGVMALRINKAPEAIKFYCATIPSLIQSVRSFMHSNDLQSDKAVILDAIHELKSQGVVRIEPPLSLLMLCALFMSVMIGISKWIALHILLLLIREGKRKSRYRKRSSEYLAFIRTTPIMLKLIH